ncbi:transcriptional regulator, GntR family protein [Pseudooceanicola batsensis HTCC2597]|uniref:Transcriptional regulator, GntR family protein n=1 Tax=Pseudooceanicola batsensis (strain ATCC BAA-863 / DSM 15984 / KCTC 12145 / HTCC2597) TaxID=252305 RepID=A3TSV1_PSEBH|nr:phosphonate metabolism transcriptional regulator PhnF [Pseudooceanicola batsensis]EAQ04728.1 transcriptional regulator, GntR family protein [Pseudooceanicola batsensis HTCC2597]
MTREKTPLWQSIASALTDDLAAGRYMPGDRLPTEAQLSARFGVNRHTVRRALRDLSDRDLVLSRRGAGVFVTQRPTDYPIGTRVRFHQNIRAAGRLPLRRILSQETRAGDEEETGALGLAQAARVHVSEGLSFADDLPMAYFRSVFPAADLPDLPHHLLATGSVTAALGACGVPDYTRAWTRITTERATATLALHLQCREGDPLLRTVSVNAATGGRPVEFGRTWFAGDRVTLTLDHERDPDPGPGSAPG